MKTLRIDPEFQALIPPATADEGAQLEANLLAEGCRDPLVVWPQDDEPPILLDGHHRFDLCQKHGLDFRLVKAEGITTREEAMTWIINNQLGRRNLTPQRMSYLRGKRYNLEKSNRGGDQKSNGHAARLNVAQMLGRDYSVDEKTIRRDGHFAQAVDTLTEAIGPDIQETLLAGEASWSKERLIQTVQQLQEAEAYPFLNDFSWKPYEKLEALEILNQFSVEEQQGVNTLLTDRPGWEAVTILRKLQLWSPADRQELYHLAQSADVRDRALALSRAAEEPPRPDPQLGWICHVEEKLTEVQGWLSRCYREFPNDPWASRLKGIVGQLRTLRDVELPEIRAEIQAQEAARSPVRRTADAMEELRRRV